MREGLGGGGTAGSGRRGAQGGHASQEWVVGLESGAGHQRMEGPVPFPAAWQTAISSAAGRRKTSPRIAEHLVTFGMVSSPVSPAPEVARGECA